MKIKDIFDVDFIDKFNNDKIHIHVINKEYGDVNGVNDIYNDINSNEFYFNCTASMTAPSRLYRLRFYDIKNPELGGTITAVLNGTEGQKMLDNLGVDNHGNILLQEDPGNNNYRAKIYNYGISSGLKTTIFDSDSTRFQTGGINFLTIDEENSGIVDIQGIKGAGWFLSFMQAHYPLPNPMTEGGQLMALFNPFTSAANSEINITGNNQNIVDGATIPNNLNNTDFGKTNIGDPLTLVFNIQNTSTGTLIISNYYISGVKDRKSTRLNSSHIPLSRMPSSA